MKRKHIHWITFLGLLALLGFLAACGGSGGGGGGGENQPQGPEAPAANLIINLSAVPNSPGRIDLSWNPVGDNRYYWIFMNDCLYTQVYQFSQQYPVGAEATKLHANTEYCFRVVAYTESPYFYVGESNKVCAVTPVDTEPPSQPTFLKSEYSVDNKEMSLVWPEATDNAWVSSYVIYRNGEYLQGVSGLSFIDKYLNTNSLHCYQVSALDESGNESQKSIKSCSSTNYSSHVAQVQQTLAESGGVRTSLALDAAGNSHVSFCDSARKDLYYATNKGGEWAITKVDTGVFGSPSLALDSSGNAHISYASDGIYSLKYATNASGSWVITIVDSYWVGLDSSLDIDADGKAHISYYDYGRGYLKYATNLSDSWITQVIDDGYIVGKSSSVAIDPSGNAHISYFDEGNKDLKYATNASGQWMINTIDSVGDVGVFSSLGVDTTGKVHIGYYDISNRALKYTTDITGIWEFNTIDVGDVGGTGWSPSLILDSLGHVHISYNDWGYDYVRFATNVFGAWKTYLVGPLSSGGSSIGLDTSGKTHISYQSGTNIYYSIYSTD